MVQDVTKFGTCQRLVDGQIGNLGAQCFCRRYDAIAVVAAKFVGQNVANDLRQHGRFIADRDRIVLKPFIKMAP